MGRGKAEVIAVIDASLGNPRSCLRMLEHIEVPAALVRSPEELDAFSRAILPGVGHYDAAVRRLRTGGWIEPLRAYAGMGRYLLGICLGMQLLGTGSDEGREEGLSLMPWRCELIPCGPGLRVPHMGWNYVAPRDGSCLHSDHEERFYFVHSYYVPADALGVSATTKYGVTIGTTIEHRNLFGVQFHPEKSHRFGMELLRRFSVVGECLSPD
jgi:imidazole glycerol-phosphate synthase subunit HisH